MPKWCKMLVGLLLVPVCVGAGWALGKVVLASGKADTTWVALLSGAGCWLAIYALLPKPMRIYVFGHEFTHVLWTWLFGGRVKKFKASSQGGHVVVTKDNFLISLAPYFFPLYAVLVVAIFCTGRLIWNWQPHVVWFHLLLGAAYAFHVTLTAQVLQISQTDITSHGYIFSGVVIFLGNALVLLAGLPLLTSRVSLLTAFEWWLKCTARVFQHLGRWIA